MTTPQEAREAASLCSKMAGDSPTFSQDMQLTWWAKLLTEYASLLERQAQPTGWVNPANLASAAVSRERGGPFDTHTWSEQRTDYHSAPLYVAPQPDEIAAAVAAERERIAKSAERWGLARQPEYGGTSLMNFASELRAGWA